jgi:hypothetical protein
MPKKIHKDLEKQANKLKLKGESRNAYIYGALAKIEKAEKKKKSK